MNINPYGKICDIIGSTFGVKKEKRYSTSTELSWPDDVKIPSFFVLAFIICWTFGRLIFGISVANDKEYCRMKSVGDFIIAPMYTIGCNIGKDRWDIRVN